MSRVAQELANTGAQGIVDFFGDGRDCKDFVDLPYLLHARDPLWIPPFRRSVRAQLAPSYPWHRSGVARHFVLPGRGRLSAFWLPGTAVGYLGSFECVDDQPLASALLDRGARWLRRQGAACIRGPVTFDTWHPYRFAVEGEGRPPFLLEPYNPPYYPSLWETHGFRAVASYISMEAGDLASVTERLEPFLRRAVRSGFRFRKLDLARFDAELALLHAMSNESFAGAPGFHPISLEGFRQIFAGARTLGSNLTVIAEHHDGRPAGFLFGYPDLSDAVRAMRGSDSPVAKARFALARRGARAAVLKTLVVLPWARGTSVGMALVASHLGLALAAGHETSIHALMAEDNPSTHLSVFTGARRLRRYALYELPGS